MPDTNPRFPHWVKITRMDINSNVNPPVISKKVILDSECRNFTSRNGGSGLTDGVIVSDYTISAPYNEIKINAGDIVEVTDRVGKIYGTVVNSYNGNLGCQIWHNKTSN